MQRFDEIELEVVPLGGGAGVLDRELAEAPSAGADPFLRGSVAMATPEMAMATRAVTFGEAPEPEEDAAEDDTRESLPLPSTPAPLMRRLMALLTDLSLFAALALALSPLLPTGRPWIPLASLTGFLMMVSYYYFVCCWLFWGKTVGGAIFDVRVVPAGKTAMSIGDASLRWCGVYLSLALAGIGFLLAALPSRLSLPDRLSNTSCVAG